MNQKRFFAFVATAFSAWLGLASNVMAWAPEYGEVPQPITRYEYLDGTPIDLTALRGTPVVLYFGADWCGPCIRYGKPATLAAFEKYKGKGVKFVFVSMDDNKIRAQKVQESQQLGLPFAMAKAELCAPGKCPDGLREAGPFGRIYGYPTAIVLNAEGRVTDKFSGGHGVKDGLDGALQKLVK